MAEERGQFGGYQVVSLLGKDGMGEVFRVHDPKLGRDVAIKTLPRETASETEWLSRFRREARTLAALNHPNIAVIYGFEEADGQWPPDGKAVIYTRDADQGNLYAVENYK